MPHFGLMDEKALGPIEGPLMRAKLHMRCGRRRLLEGKVSAGIVTLHDVLSAAMQWYVASPERRQTLRIKEGEDIRGDETVYAVLVRSGVLDGSFDYKAFDGAVVLALKEELPDFDYRWILKGIESVLMQLGVIPFDETLLPPEDPSTF